MIVIILYDFDTLQLMYRAVQTLQLMYGAVQTLQLMYGAVQTHVWSSTDPTTYRLREPVYSSLDRTYLKIFQRRISR